MRKLLFLGLFAALVLAALMLPPLSGASKKSANRVRTSVPKPDTWISSGFGQASLGRPVSMTAVGFAESERVADMAKAKKSNKSKVQLEPVDREKVMEARREKNAKGSGEVIASMICCWNATRNMNSIASTARSSVKSTRAQSELLMLPSQKFREVKRLNALSLK